MHKILRPAKGSVFFAVYLPFIHRKIGEKSWEEVIAVKV